MSTNFPVLTVDQLSKRYVIGGYERLNKSFREMIMATATAPFKRYKKLSGQVDEAELFWALKDINFQVNQGEVVGVIGKNGAGKSTLLKILSRITTPTHGTVTIRGNVASLLEVGTGFHPELTGRENIYLNGAILGMPRKEINSKFDKIVEFANIEKFVDTPVKRYSSGMYVRLAFSIAAHLDPDILIVDEVLAVGDIEFQKRCLGKLSDIATQGRTVLFVSHNMSAINRLCERCLFLENAQIVADGNTSEVIADYLSKDNMNHEGSWYRPANMSLLEASKNTINSIELMDKNGHLKSVYSFDESISISVSINFMLENIQSMIGLRVTDSMGNDLFTTYESDYIKERQNFKGCHKFICHLPDSLLRPGKYIVTIFSNEQKYNGAFVNHDMVKMVLEISNVAYDFNATRIGLISPRLKWIHQSGADHVD